MIGENMVWSAIFPEMILAVMACVITLIGLGKGRTEKQTAPYVLSQLTLLAVAILELIQFINGYKVVAWNGMVVVDQFASLLKFCAAIAVMLILSYGRSYALSRQMLKGELFSLALLSLLGAMIMISGYNLLMLYLGLEVMSLSLYALVALRRDNKNATEAAMKYFVLGALASGFMLYGMSLIYGASGANLEIGSIINALYADKNPSIEQNRVLIFGLVFLVSGLAFKLGVVPFHMWVPDVYQGSPTVITLFVSSMPKLAAYAMAVRLLVDMLSIMHVQWQQMLMILAVLSLLVGNLAAIMQSNIRRMLAYSTIAQMGFILLDLLSGGWTMSVGNKLQGGGYQSGMFYLISYVLTTLASFGVLLYLSRNGEKFDKINDLKGLNQHSPLMAAVMAIAMFSLAGIPPLVGFYAKLFVLQALVHAGFTAVAVYAVIMSLIGAYYYLRVVKVMYFDAPEENTPKVVTHGGNEQRYLLSLNGLAILLLGIFPGFLMTGCIVAIRSIWGPM